MKTTSHTEKVIAEINEFSGGQLKNIRELSILFETAATDKSLLDIFCEMQFIAKYLNGLKNILESNIQFKERGKSSQIDPEEARERITEEYRNNLILFSELLRKLIVNTDYTFKSDMEKTYLSLNKSSVSNMNSLISDLSWVKKYYNLTK